MKGRVAKTRVLPAPGSIVVDVGTSVAYDQVVGRVEYIPGPMLRLDAARALGIYPEHLGAMLLLQPEDAVSAGEVFAETSEFFWSHSLRSPIDGYLALYSRHLGYVYIREPVPAAPSAAISIRHSDLSLSKLQFSQAVLVIAGQVVQKDQWLLRAGKAVAPLLCRVQSVSLSEGEIVLRPLFQPTELLAGISGTIVEVGNGACVIAAYGYRFPGEVGYGGEAVGKLRVLPGENADVHRADLPDDLQGCLLVCRGGIDADALQYLTEQRVAGLIAGYIDPLVLQHFLPQHPLLHLGGLMETDFPMLLVNGFSGAMPDDLYRRMIKLQSRQAYLDASTQIRAGVRRPELLVVLPEEELPPEEDPGANTAEAIDIGARVRLKRGPHLGAEGIVQALSVERQETAAGTKATLIKVLLENGETLQIPLVNCRAIAFEDEEESLDIGGER